MSLTTVTALELNSNVTEKRLNKKKRYNYTQPVMFTERGIGFLVFPDGSFDFNTQAYDKYNNNYYKRTGLKKSRRINDNITHGTPNNYYRHNKYRNRGVSISHDRDGKVRRIGNVYLNYDRTGRIKRIGNVYMNYNRGYGHLTQVGGLYLIYNRYGEIIKTRGRVNRNDNFSDNECLYKKNHRSHDRDYDNRNDWYNNNYIYNNDDNYYYYKQNSKEKKHLKRNKNNK